MKNTLLALILILSINNFSFAEDVVVFPSKDTFLRQAAPNTNEGANPLLSVRKVGKRTALIAFDLSPVAGAGQSRVFKSAKLKLYIERNGGNWGKNGRAISLYRVRQDWTEGNGINATPKRGNEDAAEEQEPKKNKGSADGATWNCATDSNISNFRPNCEKSLKWKGSKIVEDQIALASILITNETRDYVEFDVTEAVRFFYVGTDINDSNFGWMIKRTTTSKTGSIWFYSSEASDSSKWPQLTVSF